MPVVDSDVERLKTAFGAARERGFGADLRFSAGVCCAGCAHAETERGPKGYLVTHRQAYGTAFWGDPDGQPPPELIEAEIAANRPWLVSWIDDEEITELDARTDLDDDERADLEIALQEAWSEQGDNADRLDAALAFEREHQWHTLLAPLFLYWSAPGGVEELVGILRAAGLTVTAPENDDTAIMVLPDDRPAPPRQSWPGDAIGRELAAERESG